MAGKGKGRTTAPAAGGGSPGTNTSASGSGSPAPELSGAGADVAAEIAAEEQARAAEALAAAGAGPGVLEVDPASPVVAAEGERQDDARPGEPIVTHLRVRARRDGFRRCGRAWPAKGVTVGVDQFTEDQVARLLADPDLMVEPLSGLD
ncbi:HI1506-related protein [Pseudothauera rhizosphaerae]|uniref:Mu-like prophage FluMu N-terminal domain-containing protein n=1 Tax=Pseudothauera rhizosphaerae TaxID=2565932 RepID=A0A4S4AP50_9RHOO|nr:HI1506-related protein [Pseudothauera rhizosphaerae]THF60909.1 hypothetical protein E6O51_11810 [Pseudothauera rhizosphaerae]